MEYERTTEHQAALTLIDRIYDEMHAFNAPTVDQELEWAAQLNAAYHILTAAHPQADLRPLSNSRRKEVSIVAFGVSLLGVLCFSAIWGPRPWSLIAIGIMLVSAIIYSKAANAL